ncbi:Uncharacterised protein [Kluyvera cryocrescens]|uniref:Uncharacterized protein n=1 Tax=Kluyvera cryocrescens TaxID=580 RepID=A0A485AX57_KLUCR|nr:Uncharacterised protein [Kluyvera cryocrescens]
MAEYSGAFTATVKYPEIGLSEFKVSVQVGKNPLNASIVETVSPLQDPPMRFNGLTKGFFIFILALVTWAFFDVLSPYFSRHFMGCGAHRGLQSGKK